MTDKEALRRLRVSRNEALDNRGRKNFRKQTENTEKYLAGKQVPPQFEGTANEADYRVVNLTADLTDRVTAMVFGGRDNTNMRASGTPDPRLLGACQWLFEEEKREVHFSGVMFEWIHDAVSFNVGAVRTFYDASKNFKRGGYIGVENTHPLSCWISPYARDPYHPLLGSDYIGYETLMRRRDIKQAYPGLAKQIGRLPKRDDAEGQEDPTNPLTGAVSEENQSTTSGADQWTKLGETRRPELDNADKSDEDLVRIVEYEYEVIDSIEVAPGIEQPIAVWRRFVAAGEQTGAAYAQMILEPDEAIPYSLPTFVLLIFRRATNSQYGNGGLPTRTLGIQDGFNILYSITFQQLQEDAVWNKVKMGKAGVLDENDKNQILGPGPKPRYVELDSDNEFPDQEPRELISTIEPSNIDLQNRSQMMGDMAQLMRSVFGVSSAVIGDVDLNKRLSGIALHSAQQAVLVAQEAARQHINAAATNLAKLMWEMIRYHWTIPQTVLAGDGTELDINLRMPVSDEEGGVRTIEIVQELLAAEKPELNGKLLVPGALHISTGEGEEDAIPLTSARVIEAVLGGQAGYTREQIEGAEFSFNYIPALDIEIDMIVESDDVEQSRVTREAMQWAAQLGQSGTWSWETLTKEAKRNDPTWTAAGERQRLFGPQLAAIIENAGELGEEKQQALMQAIAQMLQQLQQGGEQPAEAGAAGAVQSAPVETSAA